MPRSTHFRLDASRPAREMDQELGWLGRGVMTSHTRHPVTIHKAMEEGKGGG